MWRALRQRVRGLEHASVRVGIVGAAASTPVGRVTVGLIGIFHELGVPEINLPQRSFVRAALSAKLDELRGMQTRVAKLLVTDKITLKQALGMLGAWGAGAIRAYITQGKVEPKLADSEAGRRTIARKGSSKTLVDTGQLANAVTWVDSDGTEGGR